MSETTPYLEQISDQMPTHSKRQSSWVRKFFADPRAIIGLVAAGIVLLFAFVAAAFAPYTATEIVGLPYLRPTLGHPL